jgi:hypothetical protein
VNVVVVAVGWLNEEVTIQVKKKKGKGVCWLESKNS